MSDDLSVEFPAIKGFSKRNLELIRQWFSFWTQVPELGQQLAAPIAKQPVSQLDSLNRPNAVTKSQPIAPQLVAQIPWGHNILIIQKLGDPKDALFYVQKTIQHYWSRVVLTHHIESNLHLREGRAINNFAATLSEPV